MHNRVSRTAARTLRLAIGVMTGAGAVATAQVTTAQYGNERLSVTLAETILNPRTVNRGRFGKVATLPVDGDVYAQPLYAPRVAVRSSATTDAVRDLLIVATEANSVYAFDAATLDPHPIWHTSFTDASAGVTPLSWRDVRCPFIQPDVGITSTPVIDPSSLTLYALVRTKERSAGGDSFVQRLHAMDLRTGKDVRAPVEIQATVQGRGAGSRNGSVDFDPLRENPRAALLLSRGVLYVAWASSCDVGPYHGWIMAYDAKSLQQLAVLNTSPDGNEAGVWQGDAGLAADSSGAIYAVTGNGTFTHSTTGRDFGNSVLKLRLARGALVVEDYFTPSDEARLSELDADLGSGGPLLLPADSATGRPLVFVMGKSGMSYLLNREALGRFRPGDNAHARQVLRTSAGGFGSAAYWNHTLYVWGSHASLAAYRIAGGRLVLPPVNGSTTTVDPGAMPVVSAAGTREGIVWAVETRTWRGADKPAVLHAYDASDVRRELYCSEMNPSRDRAGLATRFAVPTVAGGRVLIGTRRQVEVYGLLKE